MPTARRSISMPDGRERSATTIRIVNAEIRKNAREIATCNAMSPRRVLQRGWAELPPSVASADRTDTRVSCNAGPSAEDHQRAQQGYRRDHQRHRVDARIQLQDVGLRDGQRRGTERVQQERASR